MSTRPRLARLKIAGLACSAAALLSFTQDPKAVRQASAVIKRQAGHMTSLIDEEHYRRVRTFKQMLASYQRNRDLISVGAYAAGSDPLLDKAMTLYPQMEAYLQQGIFERSGYDEACQQLQQLIV